MSILRKIGEAVTSGGLDELKVRFLRKVNRWIIRQHQGKIMNLSLGGLPEAEIDFGALGLEGYARLRLNPRDRGLSRDLYIYGFREPLNTICIYSVVKRYKPKILDIGSNIGYFPLVELQAEAKHVIAVEPVPESFNLLKENLHRYQNSTVLNLAVSSKRGRIVLHLSDNYNVSSVNAQAITLTGRRIIGKVEVEAETIGGVLEAYGPIDMVRMDVEGYEYTLLGEPLPEQVRLLAFELHAIPPYSLKHVASLLESLESQGFQLSYLVRDVNPNLYLYIKRLGIGLASIYFKALRENCGVVAEDAPPRKVIELLNYPEVVHLIFRR